MMTLSEVLDVARSGRWAVPHFNISNFVQLKGIIAACAELRSPVMIGTSEGEVEFIGFKVARAMVDALKAETGLPLFLNADHFHSFAMCKKAIDEGYDGVYIDMSKKPYKENINETKQVVRYARAAEKDISVEGELGYIVTDSSKIYKKIVAIPQESLTKPGEAISYIEETGVDRFAAAVGSLHGIAANKPILDFYRIERLREIIPKNTTLVLHGGSGLLDNDFKRAIELGINNIHISTTIRAAYIKALKKALKEKKDETTPYKLYDPVVRAVAETVKEHIKLFGSQNKSME